MTSHPSPLVVFLLLVLVGGTGQAQSVGAAGIPLGSTALGVQGLSPLGATTGPGSPSSGSAACPSGGAAGESPPPLFDGGGIAAGGSPACMATGDSPPAGSAATAAGTGAPPPDGTGIPLGSVESAPAGLSPSPCMSAEMSMAAGGC